MYNGNVIIFKYSLQNCQAAQMLRSLEIYMLFGEDYIISKIVNIWGQRDNIAGENVYGYCLDYLLLCFNQRNQVFFKLEALLMAKFYGQCCRSKSSREIILFYCLPEYCRGYFRERFSTEEMNRKLILGNGKKYTLKNNIIV